MLQMNPKGMGPRGTPRTRWLDQIREDIEKRDQDRMEMQVTEAWNNRDSSGANRGVTCGKALPVYL